MKDALRLDEQICFSLYASSRLVTRLYQPLLDRVGLTYPQYIVLMVLWEDAPCAVSHIARRTVLNTNTLTPLLKRMEQQGLIERSRSADDERSVLISVTAQGRKLKAQCACIPEQMMAATDFAPAKAQHLKRLLDELLQTLQTSAGSAPD
jgi:DNA-binding MarR family transcriptional regulator